MCFKLKLKALKFIFELNKKYLSFNYLLHVWSNDTAKVFYNKKTKYPIDFSALIGYMFRC